MSRFFSRLNYSFGNEDAATEQLALQIEPHHRVICVTASGDRPLHLAQNLCREVIAIDRNALQNHLLHLKMAAMQELDHSAYARFLGTEYEKERVDILQQLLPHMDSSAKKYWKAETKMVQKGVLYQGWVERWFKRISAGIRFTWPMKVQRLLACDTIEEQQDCVHAHWNTASWRALFDVVGHPLFTRLFIRDLGLYAHVCPDMKTSDYLYSRIQKGLNQYLVRNNLFLSLFFRGIVESTAFPPYLTKQGHADIKPNLNRIKTVTADLVSYLENCPANSIDRFSLSDVASYLSQKDYLRLLHAVVRTATPEARFCIRQFISRRSIPDALRENFLREPELEEQLEQDDSWLVYGFMVGRIQK